MNNSSGKFRKIIENFIVTHNLPSLMETFSLGKLRINPFSQKHTKKRRKGEGRRKVFKANL
jgi:hypothetical protein